MEFPHKSTAAILDCLGSSGNPEWILQVFFGTEGQLGKEGVGRQAGKTRMKFKMAERKEGK